MKITFIGDVHGAFRQLHTRIEEHEQYNPIVQVGDLGIGFGEKKQVFPDNFYFIHGNHSNPEKCKEYPKNFLGRYGFNKQLNLFYVSGAWSIDKGNRIPGVSWWDNEELSIIEGNACIDLYEKIKPKYIVTHDGPSQFTQVILDEMIVGIPGPLRKTRTGQLLDRLLEIHRPEIWIHGHWHTPKDKVIEGTRFICLDILETKTLTLQPYAT